MRTELSAASWLLGGLAGAVLVLGTAGSAAAQCEHGVTIRKTCTGPVRICDTDQDCSGAQGECQANRCDTTNPNTTSCSISVTNADECGDVIQVNEAFDTVNSIIVLVRKHRAQ